MLVLTDLVAKNLGEGRAAGAPAANKEFVVLGMVPVIGYFGGQAKASLGCRVP